MQRSSGMRREAKQKAKAKDKAAVRNQDSRLQSLMTRINKLLPEERLVTRATVKNPSVARLLMSIGLQPSQGEVLAPPDTGCVGERLQSFKNASTYVNANADTELVGGLQVVYSLHGTFEALVARVYFVARHMSTGKLVDVTPAETKTGDIDTLFWQRPAGFCGPTYKALHTISGYPNMQCTFPTVVAPHNYVNVYAHNNAKSSVVVHVDYLINRVRVFLQNVEIDASHVFSMAQ